MKCVILRPLVTREATSKAGLVATLDIMLTCKNLSATCVVRGARRGDDRFLSGEHPVIRDILLRLSIQNKYKISQNTV